MHAIATALLWLVAAQTTTPAAAEQPPASLPQFNLPPTEIPAATNPPAEIPAASNAEPIPTVPSAAPRVETTAAQAASPGGPTGLTSPPASAGGPPPAATDSAARSRALPPELVRTALSLPADSPIKGRKVTLLELLSTTMDRRRQAEVTHAYWRLTQVIAEYHYSAEEQAALQQFQAPNDAAMLQTARASADAALKGAEGDVAEAQTALAEAAMLPTNLPLPLPADPPHVGPYRTLFEQLSAGRAMPPRTRLIDRTLPIARSAIDLRATAIHAAEDALEATQEVYSKGQVDFSAVLSALGQLSAQRRAFIAAVCHYNDDIADYVLAVASPGTPGAALVGMLIRTSKTNTAPANSSAELLPIPDTSPNGPNAAVQPASHVEPLSSLPYGVLPSGQPALLPQPGTLPLPPPPGTTPVPIRANQPTLAPPLNPETKGASQWSPVAPTSESEQPAAPAADQGAAVSQTVHRLFADSAGTPSSTSALYPALLALAADARAKELSDELHRDPSTPETPSQPINLEDCLRSAPVTQRGPAIHAYWRNRQKAAQYRALRQTADQLVQLAPVVLEHGQDPLRPLGMLWVRAEQLAVEAEITELHADLLTSQFELSQRLGRPTSTNWLLASTPPHAGPYDLNLKAQSPAVAQRWPIQRAAAAVPALTKSLQARATAVVLADQARAQAWAGYASGTHSLRSVLAGIHQQSDQTQAFLDTLTEYNDAIADYVLAVVPANAPANLLSQTLVLK